MKERAILLVEDNPDDELLMLRALAKNDVAGEVVVARDGVEALDYLFSSGRPDDAMPRLILLDLKLPGMSGFDVLQAVRSHASEHVRRTPVVVLTTSRAPADVRRAYELCANSFLRKPLELPEFIDLIGAVRAWWLERVELP